MATEAGANETSFQPGSLNYSVSGPSTVKTLLMQQASGWWILAIWNSVPVWNGSALNPQNSVTVTYPSVHSHNWVNDLITGGARDAGKASSVQLTLTANPIILAVSPN